MREASAREPLTIITNTPYTFFRIKNSRVSEVRGKRFRRSVSSFSRRWSSDFWSGGLAIKARCKLACERDLRDYTQGRVGRPPRFRLYKKKRRLRETCTFSESGHPDGRQRSASGGESVEHGGALYKGRARGRASRSLSAACAHSRRGAVRRLDIRGPQNI